MSLDVVAAVRAFSRFYTNRIGVLHSGLLDTPYSLTEGRVIFDLAQHDAVEVVDLRRGLDIDPGYLSRILRRFEADGLIERRRSPDDARRQVIALTERGRRAYDDLDARSAERIGELVEGLGDADRRRLVAAFATVQEVLGATARPRAFVIRPLRAGDLGWVVHRHGVLYADEYGWDRSFESLVARIVADYADADPSGQNAWIAEADGDPVGCVFCVRKDDETAQLRLLLVDPKARGLGIGARLVDECVRFAKGARYRQIMLWTNDVLADARRIYERAGFFLVREDPHHSFGQSLVGQVWQRPL